MKAAFGPARRSGVVCQISRPLLPSPLGESIFHFEETSRADPVLAGWGTWVVVHAGDRVVIGEGGYAGLPDAEGAVEIGYAIVPSRCAPGNSGTRE
ncbi:MAG TPA: hypothetical protein VLA95_04305 [Gemmatimonadales bacterium]|nr:hypothetical protein [Gemmatimonadales bacterium]